MHEDKIEAELWRRLRKPRNATLYSYLVDRGFVEEGIDALVSEARRILNIHSSSSVDDAEADIGTAEEDPGAPAPPGPPPGEERAWAVSQLAAVHAGEDPEIVAFREHYLGQRLMNWSTVEDWINDQAKLDHPTTTDLTVTVEDDRIKRTNKAGIQIDPPLAAATRYRLAMRDLPYVLPGDQWVRRVGVSADGVLGKLSRLADRISGAYGWTQTQAVVFVLCGVTPMISTVRSTASPFHVRHGKDLAWSNRIVLNIDPAASPREVLAAFQKVRQQQGLSRLRALSSKHARLAAFTGAEHADKTWAERFALWNSAFQSWQWSDESNFRRDAIRAQARLLYPGRHPGQRPLQQR